MSVAVRVGLVLALAGCSADVAADLEASLEGVPPDPKCASASDCADGLECHGELRICTAKSGAHRTIALVARPLPDSAFAPSHVPKIELTAENPIVDVVLPKTVRLTGRVRVMGNALDASVEATVFAFASEKLIPGEERTAQATVKNDFALTLQAGVEYELSINAPAPEGDRPTYRTRIRYEADTDETFWLPAIDSHQTISGRVVRKQDSSTVPVADVRVTATNDTGTTTCTSAVTGKLGDFVLRCADEGRYAIEVQPTDTGPVVPTFRARLPYGTSRVDEWEVKAGHTTLPDIVVPPTSRETQVAVRVRGDGSTLLDGAEVTLVTLLEDGDTWTGASIRRTASTDRQGQAELRIVEGSYELHVLPAPSDPWAATAIPAWQVPADASRPVDVGRRPSVTGTVTAADGTVVANARVAFAITEPLPGHGPVARREYVGKTDDEGRYEVPVDPGEYELLVDPRPESGAPAYFERLVTVGTSAVSKDVQLGSPIVLEGTVVAPDGTSPVDRVLVEALDVDADGWVTSLGRGRTDETGHYFIILSAE